MDNGQFELTPEQQQLREVARRVSEEFRDKAVTWEDGNQFPWENLKRLGETGLLGVAIPAEYGGGGGGWLEAAIVLEEIGRTCYITAMSALGELGVQTQSIAIYGSEELKQRYLPPVAAGDMMCSVCITEPDTGSDVASMSTVAQVEGDEVVVTGRKTLISRADVAGVFIVFVRFADDEGDRPIGAVVLDGETAGITIEQSFDSLGGDSLHEVSFTECRAPVGNILARTDGFRKMMTAFNGQRCLNASISVGIAQGAQDAGVQYASERHQFGRPIARHQGIGWMLADNAIQIEAARLLVQRGAARTSQGFPTRYDAAVAKTFANEMALRVTDSVMQVFGGHGWIKEMPAERYLRWARYGPLGGGTPQIQRNGIIHEILRQAQ